MDQPQTTELQAENTRLKAVLKIINTLAGRETGFDSRLQKALQELAGLIGAENTSIMLIEGDYLAVKAASNPDLVGMSQPLSAESIAAGVARSARPFYTTQIAESDYAEQSRDGDASSYRTGSLISLPLMDGDKVLGVMNLADKIGEPHFAPDDLAAAEFVSGQVAGMVGFSAMHHNLKQAYAELGRSETEKMELSQIIIHDLKAPLTGAKEMVKLLAAGELDDETRAQLLALTGSDLELLWRRVSNLLDINRFDGGDFRPELAPVPLSDLCNEAMVTLASSAVAAGVDLEFQGSEPARAMCDDEITERIIINLLFNAIAFSSAETGGGGRVVIRLSGDGDTRCLEVADTGPGVDESLGEAIFQRHTSRRGRGSSGLGLHFCRRAAWLMGGEVSFCNNPEGGASFFLHLPGA